MNSSVRILLFVLFTCHIFSENCCFQHLESIGPTTSYEIQVEAVKDLINRLIPARANEFSIQIYGGQSDYFEIEVNKNYGRNDVIITASTGVMAAWGFHYYITKYCNCHVSWDGDQLNLPKVLPDVSVRISSLDKFRYYQNVCTVSYSSAWWKWPRWEREIDWMALNGINLPLAFTGQEAIWKRVLAQLGLEQSEIDEHFAGPAFLAWQRMGNFRGWGGPLSDNWHHATLELQHKILDRMRSFGMIPVLPAFAGHVPRAIQRIYPNASLTRLTPWLDFEDEYCCPDFLQPTDKLFSKIGSLFLTELIKEFGTDHVYNCDVFNEMRPQQSDPAYLSSIGSAVYSSMKTTDPGAIWVMQGWLFSNDADFWTEERSKALLTSVPIGSMLILDLQADVAPQYPRMKSFYGQPFIYCLLHNFGGTHGMYGVLPTLAESVLAARQFPNSTMVGTGLTMEGIDQNYVVYDFMLEMGWRNEKPELVAWAENYSIRRYGIESSSVIMGWRTLMRSVYNASSDVFFRGRYSIMNRRPSLKYKPSPTVWYDPQDVILAWDYFILATTEPGFNGTTSITFQHDLIDLTRQALQELFNVYYSKLVTLFQAKDYFGVKKTGEEIINLFRDLDQVLLTGHKFLLGKWLQDAKLWGITKEETLQYEWNARNQITLWGPRGEILDYAIKQWSGVVNDYLLPRWDIFVDELKQALRNKCDFNNTLFRKRVFNEVEKPFTFSTKLYEPFPTGDAVAKCTSIYEKWRPIMRETIDSLPPKARSHWMRFRLPANRKPKKGRHSTKRVRLTSG